MSGRTAYTVNITRFMGNSSAPMLGWLDAVFPSKANPEVAMECEGVPDMGETPLEECEHIVKQLDAFKRDWVVLQPADRADVLRKCLSTTPEAMWGGAEAAARAFGSSVGAEGQSWVPVLLGLSAYIEAMEASGQPKVCGMHQRASGQHVVDVFPSGYDALLFPGARAEVWVHPGQEPSQGSMYRRKAQGQAGAGGVSLVLGAGNQVSVPILDILHKLLSDDEVVVCKMNPANAFLGPYVQQALQPLHDLGAFKLVYGGVAQGEFFCQHPLVTSVHLTGKKAAGSQQSESHHRQGGPPTAVAASEVVSERRQEVQQVPPGNLHHGSMAATLCSKAQGLVWGVRKGSMAKGPTPGTRAVMAWIIQAQYRVGAGAASTFDAIVWGRDNPEKRGEPKVGKPVGAELGCVTPLIVVPGPWSSADIKHQARNIASSLVQNMSHNCLAAEVLVTSKDWPLRQQLVDEVKHELSLMPPNKPWYPGSDRKMDAFQQRFPQADAIQGTGEGRPWLFKTGLTPENAQNDRENWSGCLQEVALPGQDEEFVESALQYVNERLFGTLSCMVFMHPSTQANHPELCDTLIAGLRYGSIVVNAPASMGYSITQTGWGAYPGNDLRDIGSGNTYVHNTAFLDHPEKSVIWIPFRVVPHPPWSTRHTNIRAVVESVADFYSSPSMAKLPGVIYEALRSKP